MGTIVDGMEYWEASTNQREDTSEDQTLLNMREELKFLRDKIRNMEQDLRNAEDKNVQLYNEIDYLKNHIENLKEKYCKEDDDQNLELLLRERILSLEDSYAKLRVKYKRNRSEIKELKYQLGDIGVQSSERDSESVSSIFTSDLSEQVVDMERFCEIEKKLKDQCMISSQLQEQNDINSETNIKQKELIGHFESQNALLTTEINTMRSEVANIESILEQEKRDNEQNKNKIKESQIVISNLTSKKDEIDLTFENYKKNTEEILNIVLKQVSGILNELGSEPLDGIEEIISLEEQKDILTQSLITMALKVKEVQKEKHEKISPNFKTSISTVTASNGTVETEMKLKNDKTTEKLGANYNKIVEVGSEDSANNISISFEKNGKPIHTHSIQSSDAVQKHAHFRKLGVPSFLRSISHETDQKEDSSSSTTKQIGNTISPKQDSFIRKGSLMVPGNVIRKSSLTIKKDILNVFKNEESCQFPPFPALLLQLQNRINDEQGTEEYIEKEFALLTMAMKSDRMSLLERVGGQRVQRNATEASIEQDINQMKSYITTINQSCDNSEMRDKIMKIEKHLNVLHQSAGRVSAAAESFGAVQIESKVQSAVGSMVKHITNLRLSFSKNKKELTEMKNLLKEYSLMEEEEEYQDQKKIRNYSTSVLSDISPETDFSFHNQNTQDQEEGFYNKQDGELELESSFIEQTSSPVSSSSPPSRRESQNSTPELLHVNSMELSQTARRLTVGWLTEIEIPTWLDLDKLPDVENVVWFSRFLIATSLFVVAFAILWSTFFT